MEIDWRKLLRSSWWVTLRRKLVGNWVILFHFRNKTSSSSLNVSLKRTFEKIGNLGCGCGTSNTLCHWRLSKVFAARKSFSFKKVARKLFCSISLAICCCCFPHVCGFACKEIRKSIELCFSCAPASIRQTRSKRKLFPDSTWFSFWKLKIYRKVFFFVGPTISSNRQRSF